MIRQNILCTLFFCCAIAAQSQQNPGRSAIQKAIDDGNFKRADSLLQRNISFYVESRIYDSLPFYTQLLGSIRVKTSGADLAVKEVIAFTEKIVRLSPQPEIRSYAYDNAADFLSTIGKHETAYKYGSLAYTVGLESSKPNKERLAALQGDLGTYAMRAGNVKASQDHNRNAIKALLALPNPDSERLYMAANHMGSSMWMATKIDSAIFYYDIAFKALDKTEKNPHNQFFRPALMQNNLAGLYSMQGKTTAAIAAMKSTIDLLSKYLAVKENLPKRESAIEFQFEATDNLAGIYRELGDYSRALGLLQYSYQQKIKTATADSSGIFKSQILLGQIYVLMKNYVKGEEMLQLGLRNISRLDGDYLFWQADACYSLATMHSSTGNKDLAEQNYLRADSLYELSMQGEYDDIYMEFLRNASLFFAEHGRAKLAMQKANKGFEYVKKTQGSETLLAFYQLLNLGQVAFAAKDYNTSLKYSEQGLSTIGKLISHAQNPLDSIKLELHMPRAILLNVKSKYYLSTQRTEPQLKSYLAELNSAVEMLDKRKTVIHSSDDIALMVSDHGDLIEFIKQINLELFRNTNDIGMIDRLIGMHESGIYMRIRSRLDRSDSMHFAHIPNEIPATERRLKEKIRNSLTDGSSHESSMKNYFSALDEWQKFQENIKKKYPEYYEMRYATIFKPIDDVQSRIPANTTLIRYFFIGGDLYAMVIDKANRKFVTLDATDLASKINSISSYSSSLDRTSTHLHQLHKQLWEPLGALIKTPKVVIVPDGLLYNLSFELLTPSKIKDYSELATNSLLAKHAISYHYSLFLVGQNKKEIKTQNNFIAFAPGFLDENKSRYASTVTDSLSLDRSYLNLLPQPFSIDFASKTRRLLAGTAFVNEASTAANFRSRAGGNKIIHLGTHAESNNIAPEYSRLIFSKSANAEDDNSIFLHEIYNCNLNSELAVLTACESGKPGFQDGEGMISLAHAFNYAGSESILTGLWSIDEKSSTTLMEYFYSNLIEGMDKDEALRLAKIKYLQNASGRMLAPQYWAGLVLMGDTSPIEIKKKGSATIWIIAGLGVLLIGFGLVKWFKGGKRV